MRRRIAMVMALVASIGIGAFLAYSLSVGWRSSPKAEADPSLVQQLQAFDQFPLYWPGPAVVDGTGVEHALAHVDSRDRPAAVDGHLPRSRLVSLIYGTCTPAAGSEGSCVVPITIYIEPTCDQPLEKLADAVKVGDALELRGATAQRSNAGLWIYAADVTVSIFTAIEGSREDNYRFSLEIADSLEGVNSGGVARVPTSADDLGAYEPSAPCP